MKNWNEISHYAGLDWAKNHHQVLIVDRQAQIVAEFEFEHSAEGWKKWRETVSAYPGLAVAIETNQGAAVEQLLQSNVAVYPVNPRAAKAYRQRKVPTGNKTDRLDAWSLAEALRVDGHSWRPLQPLDPIIQELRLLCRDEMHLIGQRTELVNQLQQALSEYYPAALQAFEDWTLPGSWKFLERFPSPEALTKAGPRKWEAFLHCHKLYRPQTHSRRLECFRKAMEFSSSSAVVHAKSMLALSLVKLLVILERQLQEYRKRIEKLFASHPDHDLFGSLPGAGAKLAPRLLSELGDDRGLFPDVDSLRCYAGTAPVSYQSGQVHKVYLRRQCNKYLRCAIHLWADLSRRWCQWAQVYYQQVRQRGKSHAEALRCLGHRWLKIIWKMWQSRTPYDSEFHMRNQLKHGSWVLQMMTKNIGEQLQ
jgi:transposase